MHQMDTFSSNFRLSKSDPKPSTKNPVRQKLYTHTHDKESPEPKTWTEEVGVGLGYAKAQATLLMEIEKATLLSALSALIF